MEPDASKAAPRLQALARQTLAARLAVSDECRKLLDTLRQRCPGLLPPDPLPAGGIGADVPLDAGTVQRLAAAAAQADGAPSILWTEGDNSLLVHAAKIAIVLDHGLVIVTIPVACDEVGDAIVQVPFAVGDEKRPAGFVAATEVRPRGPAPIVDVWGDALVAFAWRTLIELSAAVAGQSGIDEDGAGLIPAALTATPDGVRILTMARQTFDRVTR